MNKNDIIIRAANIDDLKLITQYTIELHRHEDDGAISTHPNFSSNLKKWLSSELNNSQFLFLIAELENKQIGFIGATSIINDNGFLVNPVKGVIQLLWVEKQFRKQKIAQQLVNHIEVCFKEMGINVIECSYTASNRLAEFFWNKQGYDNHNITARKFI